MTRKPISPWAAPLGVGLSLPIGLIVGREFGGESPGLRILYGGAAAIIVALAVAFVVAVVAQQWGQKDPPDT